MSIKGIKNLLMICIWTIIILIFNSCDSVNSDTVNDIKISVEIEASNIYNVQVYTVNGWKYVEDGLVVTVDENFRMKFLQEDNGVVKYFYFSNLIATTEGTIFTIENKTNSIDNSPQVWRNNRSSAFTVDPIELNHYKIDFDETTITGTVTYQSPYIDVTNTSRVDYNEDQSPYLSYIIKSNGTNNFFGTWDFSNDETPVLGSYSSLEIYVSGTVYTLVDTKVLTENKTTIITLSDLETK